MQSLDLWSFAEGFAFGAHAGQTDKAGRPYTEHLQRVVANVVHRAYDGAVDGDLDASTSEAVAVAWLHDTVEDTAVTLDDLHAAGFPDRVVDAVDVITHRAGEPRRGYYARVRRNKLALIVKRADVEDNGDPDRLALLDEATRERLTSKYAQARDELAWYDPTGGTR